MRILRRLTVIMLAAFLLCSPAFSTGLAPSGGGTPAEGQTVYIALIDTGISTAAIDPARIAEGKNYIRPEDGAEDRQGHGTALASLLAGGIDGGVEGVCPDAMLVPLVYHTVVDGEVLKGDLALLAQIVREAVDVYGCRVINISSGAAVDEPVLRDAVLYAEQKGAVVVSAVGNDYTSAPGRVYYPAAYETVIGVGALQTDGQAAAFSQRGASVTLCAPGVDLYAAAIDGTVQKIRGTSVATALVSGAAARLLAAYPELTPEQVRRLLCASAADLGGEGWDESSGWGALDTERALELASLKLFFSDVPPTQWYTEAVAAVSGAGLMQGTSDTAFEPHSVTSRGMIVTILYRLEGEPAITGANPFDDVEAGKYYENAMIWAAQNKIVEGYGNGRFGPDDSITREQMAAILYRYAAFKGYNVTATADLTKFSDMGKISDYAQTPMRWAIANELLAGKGGGILDPKGDAARCQAAAILHRFCESVST